MSGISESLFEAYSDVCAKGLEKLASTFCNVIGRAADGTLESVLPENRGKLEAALRKIAGVDQADLKIVAQAFGDAPSKGKPTEGQRWEAMRRAIMEAAGSPVADHTPARELDVSAIWNRFNASGRNA